MNFGTKFVQKGHFSLKTKSEHHDSVLHIQISLGAKIQLKLTILIFWQFFEKGISGQKLTSPFQDHSFLMGNTFY